MGLQQADFELLVDGQVTPIAFFDEHNQLATDEGKHILHTEVESQPLATAETSNGNSYIVFLDDFYTNRLYRRPLIQKLIEDLALLGPNDHMAIVRFRGQDLEIDAELTSDRDVLEAAYHHALEQRSGEMIRKNRLAVAANDEAQRAVMNEQLDRVTKAIATAMDRFQKAPGRKVLFLVSEGWLVTLPLASSGVANLLQVVRNWQEKLNGLPPLSWAA